MGFLEVSRICDFQEKTVCSNIYVQAPQHTICSADDGPSFEAVLVVDFDGGFGIAGFNDAVVIVFIVDIWFGRHGVVSEEAGANGGLGSEAS